MKKLITILLSMSGVGSLSAVATHSNLESVAQATSITAKNTNSSLLENDERYQSTGLDGCPIFGGGGYLYDENQNGVSTMSSGYKSWEDLPIAYSPYEMTTITSELEFDLVPILMFNGDKIDEDRDLKPIHVHFNSLEMKKELKIEQICNFKNANIAVSYNGTVTITRDDQDPAIHIVYELGFEIDHNAITAYSRLANTISMDYQIENSRQLINTTKINNTTAGTYADTKNWDYSFEKKFDLYRGWTPATTYGNTDYKSPDDRWFVRNFKEATQFDYEEFNTTGIVNGGVTQEELDNKATESNHPLITGTAGAQLNPQQSLFFHTKFNIKDYDSSEPERMRMIPTRSLDSYIEYIETLLNGGSANRRFTVTFDINDYPNLMNVFKTGKNESAHGDGFDKFSFDVTMRLTDNLMNRSKDLVVTNCPEAGELFANSNIFDHDRMIDWNFKNNLGHHSQFVNVTESKDELTTVIDPNESYSIDSNTVRYAITKKGLYVEMPGISKIIGLEVFDNNAQSPQRRKFERISDNVLKVESYSNKDDLYIYGLNLKNPVHLELNDKNKSAAFSADEVNWDLTIGEWKFVKFNDDQFFDFKQLSGAEYIDSIVTSGGAYIRAKKAFTNQLITFGNINYGLTTTIKVAGKVNESKLFLDTDLSKLDVKKTNYIKISNYTYTTKLDIINKDPASYAITYCGDGVLEIKPISDTYGPIEFSLVGDNEVVQDFSSESIDKSYVDATDYTIPSDLRNPTNPNGNDTDPDNDYNPSTDTDDSNSVTIARENNVKWIVPLSLMSTMAVGWFTTSMIQMKRARKQKRHD